MAEVRSLRDKMAENPEAYAFAGAKGKGRGAKAAAEAEAPAVPLSVLLGGSGQPIERKGVTFYPHSPELGQLDALTAVAEDDSLKEGAQIVKLATFVLYVHNENCEERDATEAEIAKAFTIRDAGLLKTLFRTYCAVESVETAEGNA